MKQLHDDYTTVEQSKRLLELGVPEWTANYVRSKLAYDSKTGEPIYGNICAFDANSIKCLVCNNDNFLPAWSVGRLIEIYNMCVDFDLDDGAAIVIFIQDESPIVQMIEMFEDKVGIMDFSKLEE